MEGGDWISNKTDPQLAWPPTDQRAGRKKKQFPAKSQKEADGK